MSWDEGVLLKFAPIDSRGQREEGEEEWVPKLAKAIEKMWSGGSKYLSVEGLSFVESTVITGNFADILSRVYGTIAEGGNFCKFLNVDMGFGKTHLLVYLLYTLYRPSVLFERVDPEVQKRLRSVGFDKILNKEPVVFAFDFTTPTRGHLKHALNLFATTLSKAGQTSAADLVRKSADANEVPDAGELFEYIGREIPVVVLLDELYYPATRFAKEGDIESGITLNIVTFVKDILEQELVKRPLVILAASARTDVYHAHKLNETAPSKVYNLIESFLSRLDRYEAAVGSEVQWLSVDEALEILERRLELRGKLHESMKKFATRFLGPDPELGNQHLRSLLRATAMMALDEARTRRRFVSVANFGENVLDFLFGGSQSYIASRYKDALKKSLDAAKSDAGKDAVKAIFALTVVSNVERLAKIIMADLAKLRSEIPRVSARELQQLLSDLGYSGGDIARAFDEVERAPYVAYIDEGGERFYHVSFVESPTALIKNLKEVNEARYLNERQHLIERIDVLLRDAAGQIKSGWLSLYIFENPNEVTKGLRPEKFHLLLHRGSDAGKIVKNVTKQNFAVAVVDFDDEKAQRHLAEFFATYDAINDIAKWYMSREGGTDGDEDVYARIMRKWLKAVKEEVENEVRWLMHVSLQKFIEGLKSLVRRAYVYACTVEKYGYDCEVQEVLLEYEKVEKAVKEGEGETGGDPGWRKSRGLSVYANTFYTAGINIVAEFLRQLAQQVAHAASVVYEPNPGLISEIVLEHLEKSGEFSITTSSNLEVAWRGRMYYVLPTALGSIEDIAKRLSHFANIIREEKIIIFRKKAKKDVVAQEQRQTAPQPEQCLESVVAEIEKRLGDVGWAKLDAVMKCGEASVDVADVAKRTAKFRVFEYGGKVLIARPGASVPLSELLQFLHSADNVELTIRLEVDREQTLQLLAILLPLQRYVKDIRVE